MWPWRRRNAVRATMDGKVLSIKEGSARTRVVIGRGETQEAHWCDDARCAVGDEVEYGDLVGERNRG